MRRLGLVGCLFILLWVCAWPGELAAQITWQDLVFTAGVSAEAYRGNLPAITVTAVDDTEAASAGVGEFGVRGNLSLLSREGRNVSLQFDAGLRQFAAAGFNVRDYAPRELVGRVDLSYRGTVGTLGELWIMGGGSGRRVEDRPPMPMFIQPGYGTVDGRVRLALFPIDGIYYDAQVFGEVAAYETTQLRSQLALLDRRVFGVELGATWGTDQRIRGYAGFRASKYPNQGTFDPSDPLRRDKTFSAGVTWNYRASSILASVGVEGLLNRSNSSRPEYNALRLRGFVTVPMPQDFSLSLFADLTAKDYLTDSEFALLVPGEEADNASIVYLEASRPLYLNLDGAVRFGWTRAEEDIGKSYFERFAASVLFRFRPFN